MGTQQRKLLHQQRREAGAAIGVENLVIVSTKDAVLVMNRERSQDVKKAVEFLKQNQRSEYKRHREIYRPRAVAT